MVGVTEFERLSRTLRRRVLLMVGRAVLRLVDDARRMQSVQVEGLAGEVIDGAERFQQYGFTSHPHPGAECLLLAAGGMRQHPLVAAVDDRRFRPTGLAEGEVCLYTSEDRADNRHRIVLERGRVARIECGDSSIVVETDRIALAAGGSTVVLNAAGVDIDGARVDLN